MLHQICKLAKRLQKAPAPANLSHLQFISSPSPPHTFHSILVWSGLRFQVSNCLSALLSDLDSDMKGCTGMRLGSQITFCYFISVSNFPFSFPTSRKRNIFHAKSILVLFKLFYLDIFSNVLYFILFYFGLSDCFCLITCRTWMRGILRRVLFCSSQPRMITGHPSSAGRRIRG